MAVIRLAMCFKISALAAISVLSAAAPIQAWEAEIFRGPDGRATSVALAANGDIMVLGSRRSVSAIARVSPDGTRLWRANVSHHPQFLRPDSITLDSAGDVLAPGQNSTVVTPDVQQLDFAVIKMRGADGSEVWRYVAAEPPGGWGFARALAIDPSDDVTVTGFLGQVPTPRFTVIKLAGGSGAEIWRYEYANVGTRNYGRDVAITAGGDVVAVGTVDDVLGAVKLDGATGTEVWRITIPESSPSDHYGTSGGVVALDAAEDVIIGGILDSAGAGVFGVVKLSGADGQVLWQRKLPGTGVDTGYINGAVVTLVLDAAGDVLAGGFRRNLVTERDLLVAKLSGASGAVLWEREIASADPLGAVDGASAVALLPSGDVGVTGVVGYGYALFQPGRVLVARLSGLDGSEQWRRLFAARAVTQGNYGKAASGDLLVDGAGNLVTNATLDNYLSIDLWGNQHDSGIVAKLGAGGEDVIAGDRLHVSESQGRVRLRFKSSTGIGITLAPESDPTAGGASLELRNPGTGETATVPLAGWHQMGPVANPRGYRHRGAACHSVVIRATRVLVIRCKDVPGFSLDEASQGALQIRLTTGTGPTARVYCASFGGTIVDDRPRRFHAKDSPAPASCN